LNSKIERVELLPTVIDPPTVVSSFAIRATGTIGTGADGVATLSGPAFPTI